MGDSFIILLNMDRRKLIAQTAQKSGYAKWEVNKIVDSLLDSVSEVLQQGEEVDITGFGRFELKVRKARKTFHPRTKQPVHIPEKVSVGFAISKKFKPNEGVIEKIRSKGEAPK